MVKMLVFVNGQQEDWDRSISVTEWLEAREMLGKRIAVEINGRIIPKSQFAEHRIQENDVLEIIAAVGGG